MPGRTFGRRAVVTTPGPTGVAASRSTPGAPPRRAVTCALAAAWLALAAARVPAQEVAGALEGVVADAAGAALADVRVTVTGRALQGLRAVRTDARGRYHVPLLPVGSYAVAFSRLGYAGATLADVTVDLGAVTRLPEVQLATHVIEIAGTTAVAARPSAPVRAPPMGGRLTADVMRALPADRDVQSLVAMLPHASASAFGDRANLAGTTGPESRYYVDGADVVEPPGNALSTSLPYHFIEQIDVRAGGYPAEFGGAGGGIVNAVTASGGDRVSGHAFAFFADRLFTADDVAAIPERIRGFRSWDAGASLGGPVVRERLWYFVAYDPAFEREDVRLPGFGTRDDVRRVHRFAAKLTAGVGERTRLVLSALGDPGTHMQVGGVAPVGTAALANVDPMLARQQTGGANVALRATRTLGAHAYVEAAAGVFASRFTFEARTPRGIAEPLYVDPATSFVEGGVGSFTDRHAGRASTRAAVGWARGAHTAKAGVAYDDEWFRERLDLDQVTRLTPQLYRATTLVDRVSHSHIRSPSAFAQDAWQVSPRLRVDAGLRWADEYWIASGGTIGQRIAGQWQPRAGLAWRPAAGGTSVFTTYGRDAQRTRLNLPGLFLQDVPSTYLVRIYDHDPRVDPSGGFTYFQQTLGHQEQVRGLRPALFDEFQLGAEHEVGRLDMIVRGVVRVQRDGIVAVPTTATGDVAYGNPGRGALARYPRIERRYSALEFTARGRGRHVSASATYAWSRVRGNYEGYWDQTARTNDPLGAAAFVSDPRAAATATGPLPLDRPQQLKAWGSAELPGGVSLGVTASWASGTPISELGATPYGAPYYQLLAPRGSRGRTPALYDVDVRLACAPPPWFPRAAATRFLVDAYHLGNPRRTVLVDEVRYQSVDGAGRQQGPNPAFGEPLLFQPGAAYRFGVETSW